MIKIINLSIIYKNNISSIYYQSLMEKKEVVLACYDVMD
jgi:hypothetical protein